MVVESDRGGCDGCGIMARLASRRFLSSIEHKRSEMLSMVLESWRGGVGSKLIIWEDDEDLGKII